jgi:Protein of unknown function (DUF2510)
VTDPRPPGWYDDPSGSADRLRWWDGSAWTSIDRERMPHERAPVPLPDVDWSRRELLDSEARPPRRRGPWIAVLLAVGLIGGLVLTGVLPGVGHRRHGNSAAPSPTPVPTFEPQPSPVPTTPVPVSGRVTDPASGLSYDVLPGDWRAWDLTPFSGMIGTAGYYRVVQERTPTGGPYWANVTSGLVISDSAGSAGLAAAADQLATALDAAYYPKHTRTDVVGRATQVDGQPAYLVHYIATFDSKAAAGYTAKTESVTVLLVDTGRVRAAALYISLPDTVRSLWASVDGLIASVRVTR